MRTLTSFPKVDPVAAAHPVDVAVAQMLDLAKRANITFDVVDGRLVMISAHADWKLWPPVRACLDELGVDAIVDYFSRTTSEERALLSAAA